jgi:arginyl-tRNA synthetase
VHVLSDDATLTTARLYVCEATRQALENALGLLGVSAPERM